MNKRLPTIAALFVATLPCAAHAQGTIRGAEEGAAAGDKAAGPLEAIVGGAVGAATGTLKNGRGFANTLSVNTIPRFSTTAMCALAGCYQSEA